MFKLFVLLSIVAASQAGGILSAAPAYGYGGGYAGYGGYGGHVVAPAITTQNQNILRSYGNLGQVSTYSKTIDTPFSSVRKSDVRVSNPGVAIGHAYAAPAYAAPAYAAPAYAAPAYAGYAAPAYAHAGYAPAIAKTIAPAGLLGVAYSAAPTVAHMSYTSGLGYNYAW